MPESSATEIEAAMDAALGGLPRSRADALALALLDELNQEHETEAAMVVAWEALRAVAWQALREVGGGDAAEASPYHA